MSHIISYLKDETGASAAEYALLLAIITGVIVTAMGILGTAISGAITTAAAAIQAPAAT